MNYQKISEIVNKTWDNKSYCNWTTEEYQYFLKLSYSEFPDKYFDTKQKIDTMISRFIYFILNKGNKKLPKKVLDAFNDYNKYTRLVQHDHSFNNLR